MEYTWNDIDDMMVLLQQFISTFSAIAESFFLSLNDYLQMIGIDIELPSYIGADLTPAFLMFGAGIWLYIGYQFVKWIIDILP